MITGFTKKITVIIIAFILFFVTSPAKADVRITRVKLSSKNINPIKLGLITLSGDGKVLLAYEKVSDLKLKKEGYVYKLWVIEFLADDRDKVQFTEILLPVTEFQQCCISYDGKTAIITANRGAKFFKLDIPSKKLTLLFEHKKGIPGFRSLLGIMQYFNNKFYIWGYFYNSKAQETQRAMALLDLSKTGADIFQPAFDTKAFEDYYYNSLGIQWVSPSQCFILGNKPNEKDLILAFYNAGKVKIIDRAPFFKGGNICSPPGRVLYVIDRSSDVKETIIKDAITDKTWKLSSENKPYNYLNLSVNAGETAILTLIDVKQNKMSFFYAMEKDGFVIKPIQAYQNKPMCVLRLAPYGKVYATFDGSDIYWGKLE